MRRINLHGDPSIVAQEMERWERREAKLLAGTGCATCRNSETAWGKTYCMIGEKHPKCVFRGRYVERSE